MLITALEERMKDGLVWQRLLDRGMTKNKLLKEWKIKSYFLAGKAELLKKEYDASISHLEDALKILADDPQSIAEITKLKDLLSTAMKKRSAELKKEKSTWSKAFQKNKEEPEKPEPAVVAAAEHAPSQGEDMKSIEEILKTMNINVASPAGNPSTSATSGTEANGKTAKRSKDIKKESAAKRSEAEGSDDSVSDEAFGWIIGATAVIGAIGLAAFFVMKSKQK
jgi:cobalamin biosynthesis Mg chelatase CobN